MLVKGHAHRCVKAPSRAMRDNQRVKLLRFQTVNQGARRLSNLEARGRQIGNRCIGVAQINLGCFLQEASNVKIVLSILEVAESQWQRYQIFAIGAQRIDRHTARCNRSFGQFGIVKTFKNNVLMSKMVIRNLPDLRPLKADKTDHIRIFTIA